MQGLSVPKNWWPKRSLAAALKWVGGILVADPVGIACRKAPANVRRMAYFSETQINEGTFFQSQKLNKKSDLLFVAGATLTTRALLGR